MSLSYCLFHIAKEQSEKVPAPAKNPVNAQEAANVLSADSHASTRPATGEPHVPSYCPKSES